MLETDRNLLFGVLALQADLIDQGQFAEACAAWAARKDVGLAALLVERGWINDEDRRDIEKVLERKIRKNGGDPNRALRSQADARSIDVLRRLDDPDVQASLVALPETPRDGEATETVGPPPPIPPPPSTPGDNADRGGHRVLSTMSYTPESRDRYTLTHLHAKGGIGQVWLARDSDLGREVALKELRPERLATPSLWARFLEEARITGQLEHPGIVPIYELSKRSDNDAPFYTMRFVRGRTLADASRDHHKRRAEGPVDPLELPGLLNKFVGVCNAVAYAHSRGVIHRDLKGQNVVLGDFGEVIVLDWGLAKLVEDAGSSRVAAVAPVTVGEIPERDPSIQGQVIGTPAYMAPEQATGRLDLIDGRTDVYGLGSILYEILTGRPPFSGPNLTDVIRQVIESPPERPGSVAQGVAPAIEAIALKALAKAPADRYQTAGALAREVERFLADEPVEALPEPWTRKARRWARRHPRLVSGTAAMLVVGVIATSAAAVLIGRERDRAEADGRRARGAVDQMYTQVAERWLSQEPGLEPVQKEFLEKALAYYEEFAEEAGNRPEDLREAGRAARRAAEIQQRLGNLDAAEAGFLRARGRLEALLTVTNIPGWEPRQDLGHALTRHGNLKTLLGRFQEGEELHKRAWELFKAVNTGPAPTPEQRQFLARTRANYSSELLRKQLFDDAEAGFRETVAIQEKLIADFPDALDYRQDLEKSLRSLGIIARGRGDHARAAERFRAAVEMCRHLVMVSRSTPNYRQDLARNLGDLGQVLGLDQAKAREATDFLREAIAVADRLVADYPLVTGYRRDLIQLLGQFSEIGLPRNVAKDDANVAVLGREIRDAFDRGLKEAEQLAKDAPEVVDHLVLLGQMGRRKAERLFAAGKAAEAEAPAKAAAETYDAICEKNPGVAAFQEDRSAALNVLGVVQLAAGKPVDAEATLHRGLERSRAHATAAPGVAERKRVWGMIENNLGEVYQATRRPDLADAAYGRSEEIYRAMRKAQPGNVLNEESLAGVARERAKIATQGKRFADARAHHADAVAAWGAAIALNPGQPAYAQGRRDDRIYLGRACNELGDHAAASRIAESLLADGPKDPLAAVNAARLLAVAIGGAEKDPALAQPDRAAVAGRYREAARLALEKALALGYDKARAEKDPLLAPLRDPAS